VRPSPRRHWRSRPRRRASLLSAKLYLLRFRQVHLDFHTSEKIGGIGAEFDAERFAAVLNKARVNSITCFCAVPPRDDLLRYPEASRAGGTRT